MRPTQAFAVIGLLALGACATEGAKPPPPRAGAPAAPPPAARVIEFRTSDFAWSTAPGTGGVTGQVTFKAGSTPYTCSDAGVVLTPETPWVRRRMEILYKSATEAALPADEVRARTPPERSQDYTAFTKRATCDGTGKFTFANIANGPWYVITVARPMGTSGANIAIMKRVVVSGGKMTRVNL